MDKIRLVEFDVLKGISILLVIIGHARPFFPIYEFIYSFHVPLFFIVSGYFFSNKDSLWGAIVKFSKQLLKPYLFVSFLTCILYVFLFDHADIIIKESIFGLNINNDYHITLGPAWFFLALFWCRLFYGIIYKKCSNDVFRMTTIVVILSFGMVFVNKFNPYGTPFQMSQGVVCLFYYHVGYLFAIEKDRVLSVRSRNLYLIAFISLMITCCCVVVYHMKSTAMNTATLSFPCLPFDFVNAVFLCFSLYLIIKKMKHNVNLQRLNDFLSWIGRYSIVIYCIHCVEYHFTIDPVSDFVDNNFALGNTSVYLLMRLINPILQMIICIAGLYIYNVCKTNCDLLKH